jgi:hypothetical protein
VSTSNTIKLHSLNSHYISSSEEHTCRALFPHTPNRRISCTYISKSRRRNISLSLYLHRRFFTRNAFSFSFLKRPAQKVNPLTRILHHDKTLSLCGLQDLHILNTVSVDGLLVLFILAVNSADKGRLNIRSNARTSFEVKFRSQQYQKAGSRFTQLFRIRKRTKYKMTLISS